MILLVLRPLLDPAVLWPPLDRAVLVFHAWP
jgi:hypothetical protein